jgi:polyisoprenyl-teichoic acid--peptidoglycan teichoic acid transferase
MRRRRTPYLAWLFPIVLLVSCVLPAYPAVSPPATPAGAGQAQAEQLAARAAAGPVPDLAATATRLAPAATPPSLQHTRNLLVMGVDHRPDDPDPSWRTDSIMVVALDQAGSRVGIVSMPRDLYLDIPGLGRARINQADYYGETSGYPGGGPALVRRVLTETFNLPTQDYVRVQMNGLVKLVDALGGVTVTLPCPLYERTPDVNSPNGLKDWELPAGSIMLDGEMAKKFATYRYVTTDFGRTQRQQQLIWAIRTRALQLDVVPVSRRSGRPWRTHSPQT